MGKQYNVVYRDTASHRSTAAKMRRIVLMNDETLQEALKRENLTDRSMFVFDGGDALLEVQAPPVRELGVAGRTERGFGEVLFEDSYGKGCRLSCSSIVGEYEDSMDRPGTSALWLGLSAVEAKVLAREAASVGVATQETTGWVDYPIPARVLLSAAMHLDREQVAGLVVRLQAWLDKGDF